MTAPPLQDAVHPIGMAALAPESWIGCGPNSPIRERGEFGFYPPPPQKQQKLPVHGKNLHFPGLGFNCAAFDQHFH